MRESNGTVKNIVSHNHFYKEVLNFKNQTEIFGAKIGTLNLRCNRNEKLLGFQIKTEVEKFVPKPSIYRGFILHHNCTLN